MTNRETQLATGEQVYQSPEIIPLCMGYTLKILPPNVKMVSAF